MRIVIIALMLLAATHLQAQTLTSGGKLKPEQAIMDVRHYTISLAVDPVQKTIDGFTTIDVIMAQPTKVLLFDLLDSLKISNVLVNGKKEAYTYQNNLITINTAK